MRLAAPRITPLEEKDWSPDARAELGRLAEALNTLGVQLDAGLEGFARWRR
jgi:hypothetical protein